MWHSPPRGPRGYLLLTWKHGVIGVFLGAFQIILFTSTAQAPKCEMEPKYVKMIQNVGPVFFYDKVVFPRALRNSARRRHVKALPKLNGNFRKPPRSFPNLSVFLRLPYGLVCAGPPCSLFVWLCTSVHRRHEMFPRGNESNPKVRCANVITENFVSCYCNNCVTICHNVVQNRDTGYSGNLRKIWSEMA